MTTKEQTAYRKTKKFKDKKIILFEHFYHTCQICGIVKKKGLHPHHLDDSTYEKEIPLTDLVCLCSSCHREVQRILKRTKNRIDMDDFCKRLKSVIKKSGY